MSLKLFFLNRRRRDEKVHLRSRLALFVNPEHHLERMTEREILAIDREHRRLFSGCDKRMAIVDADSGKEVSTLPICDGVDGTAYDSETKLAFASCHEGKLTVVREESPDKFSVAETVSTEEGARTLTLDPKSHEVYTVTAKFVKAPAATADNPHPRPSVEPDSFVVLVLSQ